MVEESVFFLFDAAIVNSYVMYSNNLLDENFLMSFFESNLRRSYILQLASSMSSTLSSSSSHSPRNQPQQPLAHLRERHFPGQYEKSGSGRQIQQCCAVCSNKKGRGKKQRSFLLQTMPMCISPCFELHHTKVDPSRYL